MDGTTRGMGGNPPPGVVDVRPSPMAPPSGSAGKNVVVVVVLLALVLLGAWSVVGQGGGDVFWAGAAIGGAALVLLLIRPFVRRSLDQGGAAATIASGERLDAAGIPMFISSFATSAAKRNRGWTGGATTDGRLIGITPLGRSNQFRSSVYLEIEYEVHGRRYWGATGESVMHANAGALTPDGEVVVRVDPDQPERIAVDWHLTMRSPDAR